jgi:Fe-S cluster assembly iron-binding protein IscA
VLSQTTAVWGLPLTAAILSDTRVSKLRGWGLSMAGDRARNIAFDKPKEDDNVFEVDGVAVVVDKVSMQFVFGSEVDYVEGLQGAGFQVNNPNVVAACGCGSSFQVKEEAAEGAAA